MTFFHSHLFTESAVPEMLFCICGETRNLHSHKWKKFQTIETTNHISGKTSLKEHVLECVMWGEMKNHEI